MPVYHSEQQLYDCFGALFERIGASDNQAGEKLLATGLLIRFRCQNPTAELTIDARRQPLDISFGRSRIRPQLDVLLEADALHAILLGELTLAKAIGRRQLQPKGPIWRFRELAPFFEQMQRYYPRVVRECGAVAGARS